MANRSSEKGKSSSNNKQFLDPLADRLSVIKHPRRLILASALLPVVAWILGAALNPTGWTSSLASFFFVLPWLFLWVLPWLAGAVVLVLIAAALNKRLVMPVLCLSLLAISIVWSLILLSSVGNANETL